jgi:hypothetical protein
MRVNVEKIGGGEKVLRRGGRVEPGDWQRRGERGDVRCALTRKTQIILKKACKQCTAKVDAQLACLVEERKSKDEEWYVVGMMRNGDVFSE